MSNILNLSVVERYSKEYAAKICGDFFVHNHAITGKQIMSATNVPQVNMLTVRALYEKWQTDAQRMRSPFFDYENPAVQEALKNFMNTVSQYISVKREHFEPLLANATAESLVLILEPQTFYRELMRDLPDFKLTKETIAPLTRYIQVNKVMLPRLVERLNGQEFVLSNQAITWVDEISQQVEFEKPDKYLALFGEKLEIPNEIFRQTTETPKPQNTGSVSFFDQELSAFIEERAKKAIESEHYAQPIIEKKIEEINTYQAPKYEPPHQEPIDERKIEIEERKVEIDERKVEIEMPRTEPVYERKIEPEKIITPQKEPIYERKVEAIMEKVAEKNVNKDGEEMRLNEKLASEQQSLNDKANSSRSVLDMHQSSRIEGLAAAISLNQRFLFTNNLFGGNIQAFSHALDELEFCRDFSEAKELILKKYVPRYLWDITSAEAEEFIDIVKRRFN
jgi:hypothetical protein